MCAVPIDAQHSSSLEIRYPAFFAQLSRQEVRAEQVRATQEVLDRDIDHQIRLALKITLLPPP